MSIYFQIKGEEYETDCNNINDKSKTSQYQHENEQKLNNLVDKLNEIKGINAKITDETTPTIEINAKIANEVDLNHTKITTTTSSAQASQQNTKQLAKIEQINLINSVINNAELNFDPTKVNCKIKTSHKKIAKQKQDDKLDLSLLSTFTGSKIQQENQQNNTNGLHLFSTSGKIPEEAVNQQVDNMSNPESILSKLIEFRSCTTQNDLV